MLFVGRQVCQCIGAGDMTNFLCVTSRAGRRLIVELERVTIMKTLSFAAAIVFFHVLRSARRAPGTFRSRSPGLSRTARGFLSRFAPTALNRAPAISAKAKWRKRPRSNSPSRTSSRPATRYWPSRISKGREFLSARNSGFRLEPFALSNNAGRTGKPTFEGAAVTVGPGGGEFQLGLRSLRHGADQ